MKKGLHILILGCSIFYSSLLAQSGNLINNPSFESGDDSTPNNYNRNLFEIDDWLNFQSSDWYKAGDIDNAHTTPSMANSGERFIGFGPCEGAQVEIKDYEQPYTEFYYYTFSLYYRTARSVSTEINYYLLFEQANGISNCNSDDEFNKGFGGKIPISEGSNTAWLKYERGIDQEVQVVQKNKLNWFAMKGEHNGGDHNSQKFLYVDDVNLVYNDYCDHPCAGNTVDKIKCHYSVEHDDGTKTEHYDEDLSEGAKKWCSTNEIAILNLSNANYVKMNIRNRWEEDETFEWFNPKGLTNADYDASQFKSSRLKSFVENRPDLFTVIWNGRLNGKAYSSNSVYVVHIEVSNCNDTKHHTWDLTQFGDKDDHPMVTHNADWSFSPNCCTEGSKTYTYNVDNRNDRYSQSLTFKENFYYLDSVTYIGEAGQYLEILPNSMISPTTNAYFEASINDLCNANTTTSTIAAKKSGNNDQASFEESSFHSLKIFPNPAFDKISVYSSKLLLSYKVFDVQGQVLLKEKLKKPTDVISLDISEFPSGLYFIKLESLNNEMQSHKFIKN